MDLVVPKPLIPTVRSFIDDSDTHWICAADLTTKLKVPNGRDAVARHCIIPDGVKKFKFKDAYGVEQNYTFITEPNMYALIYNLKTKEAVELATKLSEAIVEVRKQTAPAWDKLRGETKTNNKVLVDLLIERHQTMYKTDPSTLDFQMLNNMINRVVFGEEAWRWKQKNSSFGLNQRDVADAPTLKLLDTIEKEASLLLAEGVKLHEIEKQLYKTAERFRKILTPRLLGKVTS